MQMPSPITLSSNQLDKLVEYGHALMSPEAVAMLLASSVEWRETIVELLTVWDRSPEYALYHKAVKETEFAIRERVIELAKKGASSEILLAEKFLREIKE